MTAVAPAPEAPSDLVPGPTPAADGPRGGSELPPSSGVAAALAKAAAASKSKTVLFIAADERRATEIGRALAVFAPKLELLVLPAWDCLPYDRVSPSIACMGRRVAVLQRLTMPAKGRRVLVASPDAILQKVASAPASFAIERGARLEKDALERFAAATGFVADERVDDPGDIAIQGRVIDVFPPDAVLPVRLDLDEDGVIEDLRVFDPASQRTGARIDRLDLVPASELVLPSEFVRTPGTEHRLSAYHSGLSTIVSLVPDATIMHDIGVDQALRRTARRIAEAHEMRLAFPVPGDPAATRPDHLYLSEKAFEDELSAHRHVDLHLDNLSATPRFAVRHEAMRDFIAFVRSSLAAKRRVLVAGLDQERAPLARALKRGKLKVATVSSWTDAAQDADVLLIEADLECGFFDADVALVTASDVFGARAADPGTEGSLLQARSAPQPGDIVVHEDHGVAILQGLETVEVDGSAREVVRLDFHGDAKLLAATEELDRIWRYGSVADAVTLDRLHTDGWNTRRVKINAHVEEAAARLVALARERAKATTAPLEPPPSDYARFVARFPFPETRDQAAAAAAILADLASGTPMNRLVCGDVGYGKTEVALRAAAAVALCGKQVALVAPTTVLARQHTQTFARRFAGTGIEIVHLSRLAAPPEAKATKRRLASGKAGIVIGTQAVTADDVDFADLALVIVDEEHRFGTKLKSDLRALAPHHLTLSATPIPRTYQAAMVGVQDVSVLAAPPARRRPVRTFLSPFDKAAAATALMREKRRGGQSFVVVPRVEDIESVVAMLADIVPQLSLEIAHGSLSPEAVDAAMVSFADGERDVLVATSLIENGLDVPRANTMLVWGAERFGLAQLHQLRGRVGRGRIQGTAYLFTPADEQVAKATADRLAALIAADRLGAGFELSARDLDLRGGGDLVGEEQAGHMRLIGASLYQQLLQRAVRAQTGGLSNDRRPPTLKIDGAAGIPSTYVPDQSLRLDLHARLAHLDAADDVDAFADELDDRFGEVPAETMRLLARRRVSILAQAAGITEIVVGPKGAALMFLPSAVEVAKATLKSPRWKGERLVLDVNSDDPDKNIASLANLLGRVVHPAGNDTEAKARAGANADEARNAPRR